MSNYTVSGLRSFTGREGYGYNVTLCHNGRKVAFVRDMADGGMPFIEWLAKDAATRAADKATLDAHVATLPPIRINGADLEQTPDIFITALVDEFENARRIARLIKAKHLFVANGQVRGFKRGTPRATVDAMIARQYPTATRLYAMPEAEAVAFYIALHPSRL